MPMRSMEERMSLLLLLGAGLSGATSKLILYTTKLILYTTSKLILYTGGARQSRQNIDSQRGSLKKIWIHFLPSQIHW